MTFQPGDPVWFYLGTKPFDHPDVQRWACVFQRYVKEGLVCVKLGTGRQVCILADRVSSRQRHKRPLSPERPREETIMAKQPTVRELRRSAKALGVQGWEELDEDALKAAVDKAESKAAKKASTRVGNGAKKATAAKAAAPAKDKGKGKGKAKEKAAASVAENGNPYKEGTNMFLITEELIKGGKRSDMVKRLKKKIDLKPRSKDAKDFDVDAEMDRRVLITGQNLRNNYGFEVTREGRGTDATIVAVAP